MDGEKNCSDSGLDIKSAKRKDSQKRRAEYAGLNSIIFIRGGRSRAGAGALMEQRRRLRRHWKRRRTSDLQRLGSGVPVRLREAMRQSAAARVAGAERQKLDFQ